MGFWENRASEQRKDRLAVTRKRVPDRSEARMRLTVIGLPQKPGASRSIASVSPVPPGSENHQPSHRQESQRPGLWHGDRPSRNGRR